MTLLRGMTWSGVIYNLFSKEETPLDVVGRQERSAAIEHSMEFKQELSVGVDFLFASNIKSSSELTEEEMLSKLIFSVTELCDIGVQMGSQIEQQNKVMDRIEEKTIRVTDETLAVTLGTAHLTQKLSNSNDGFLGTYQFIDEISGCYLSVDKTDLILVQKEDISTLFFLYEKQSALYGCQNAKTLKYLCSTPWGPIKASGNFYGRREECHLFLNGEQKGIYFLQAHWGAGGWLKRTLTPNIDNSKNGVLNAVTLNLSDRNDILLLKPVLVGPTEKSWTNRYPSIKSPVICDMETKSNLRSLPKFSNMT